MITRQELIRDLRSQHKGASWVCLAEIKRYFGLSKHKVRDLLKDMDFIRDRDNGKKLYHVIDIAKQVERFKCAG